MAWYTLFAHAFNLSNIRVKCRYSSILLRVLITRIDDEKLPNPGSRPVETHDDSVWIMVHASFRFCVSYAVIETGIIEQPSIYHGKDVFVLLEMSVLLAGAIILLDYTNGDLCRVTVEVD